MAKDGKPDETDGKIGIEDSANFFRNEEGSVGKSDEPTRRKVGRPAKGKVDTGIEVNSTYAPAAGEGTGIGTGTGTGEGTDGDKESKAQPLNVEVPKPQTRGRRSKVSPENQISDLLQQSSFQLLRFAFDMNRAMKPEPLKQLWTVSDDELKPISEAINSMAKSLPTEIVNKYGKYVLPLMAVAGLVIIIYPRMEAERAFLKQYRESRVKHTMDTVNNNEPPHSDYDLNDLNPQDWNPEK